MPSEKKLQHFYSFGGEKPIKLEAAIRYERLVQVYCIFNDETLASLSTVELLNSDRSRRDSEFEKLCFAWNDSSAKLGSQRFRFGFHAFLSWHHQHADQ